MTLAQYAQLKLNLRALVSAGSDYPVTQFPANIYPVLWLDGRRSAFADIAGTVPASAGSLVGRVSEGAPLVSDWRAESDSQRPRKDPYAFRFEYFGSTLPGTNLIHTSTPSFTTNNCTLAISFRARDAAGSPQNGLIRATNLGIFAANGVTFLTHSNGGSNWQPAVQQYVSGQRITIVGRFTATGLKCWLLVDGALTSATLTSAILGGVSSNQVTVAKGGGADQGMYGSVSQAMVIDSPLAEADALALAYWMDGQPLQEAYPTSAPLFAVGGDSIARDSPGCPAYQAWCWVALKNIRSTYPTCEMVNQAVGGSGVDNAYSRIVPYYSAARARNVYVLATGTNNLASNNGTTYTINGLLREYDAALAAGWRPAIATILDRTAGLSISQAAFDAQRATVNAAILASGRNVIDLTGVALLSANGAANNLTYFIDGIHPGDAGHALMEPIYRAKMLELAA